MVMNEGEYKMSLNPSIDELEKLVSYDNNVLRIVNFYKNRKRNRRATDVGKMLRQFHDQGIPISREELKEALEKIESKGFGKVEIRAGRLLFFPRVNMVKISGSLKTGIQEQAQDIKDVHNNITKFVIKKGTLSIETDDKEQAIRILKSM